MKTFLLGRRILVFFVTLMFSATLAGIAGPASAVPPCDRISWIPLCRDSGEGFRTPCLTDEAPAPTKGVLLLDHSMIIYVCDFKALLRITFFPLPE